MEITKKKKVNNYINPRMNIKPDIKIDKSLLYIKVTLISLILLTILGFVTFDYKNIDFFKSVGETLVNVKEMFFHAGLAHFDFKYALQSILTTFALSLITTFIGAVIALVISIFAAKNLTNIYVSNCIKVIVSFIRAVPTVLWVLIFAVSIGLGSEAAILGMLFHTVAYLTKAYSESFEELDNGIIEALKSSGASFLQIISQGVLPSSLRYIVVWTFLRFEINFTNAVAIGAVAGAGGIGFELFMSSSFYYCTREVGFITIMIVLFAIMLETSSTRIKKRLIK